MKTKSRLALFLLSLNINSMPGVLDIPTVSGRLPLCHLLNLHLPARTKTFILKCSKSTKASDVARVIEAPLFVRLCRGCATNVGSLWIWHQSCISGTTIVRQHASSGTLASRVPCLSARVKPRP